jgi:serine/threonine-protein kinase
MAVDTHQNQPAWLNAQCPREGRYVVGPLLGRGGMGDVHEAWDVVLCRTVALKMLKNLEPPALIRFMHEAQIHARLVHPNICRIYDVDNYEGTLRVAMQLVRGPNLEQVCRQLTVQEVVTILALVAQAVHLVHRLNLIHRDLKPSNILLERNAEGQWVPFVCDFGLAMALDDPPLTYSHGVIGTPAYMAPEQLQGERNRINAATDVFALGGTLHFALTGHTPTAPFTVRSQPTGEPPIPRDLRVIIGKCLEPHQDRRYPTASALAEDLWRYLEGSPIRASTRTRLGRFGFWGRQELRQLRPYLLAAATGAVLGGGWLLHVAHVRTATRQQAALAEACLVSALDLDMGFRLERAQPPHDLRPAYARIRDHLETFQAQARVLVPAWRGRGHYAAGLALFLARRYPAARTELEQAWAKGERKPRVAALLARATIAVTAAEEDEAQFRNGRPGGTRSAALVLAEARLRQTREGEADLDDDHNALMAFLQRDYQRAAAAGRSDRLASPWQFESGLLEAEARTTMALARLEEGGLDQARDLANEAVAAARSALEVGRSDPDLYHAWFRAGRLAYTLALDTGQPAPLADLKAACAQALRLNPESPELLDDWLALHWLEALRLRDLGQDPGKELAAALDALATWGREPFTPALRADRMILHWLLAERELAQGRDPQAHLEEALRTAGHTPALVRDYYWNVLELRARAEWARGVDPRPTLAVAQEQLQALLLESPRWALKEAAAENWLLRAEWEAGNGQDPAASLRSAQALAASLGRQVPRSAPARALEGLTQALAARTTPRDKAAQLAAARRNLRDALALDPRGRLQARLERAMAGLGD